MSIEPRLLTICFPYHTPTGGTRQSFSAASDLRSSQWQVLAEALRTVGISNPVGATVESSFGTRYTVDGSLQTPDGRSPRVRTVWILEPGTPGPD